MHSADIILIWNSFLSAVAGTTPAWLHPKSITLLGPLARIWRGTERHSVQVLSQTFNLKDNVVFSLWRTSLIPEWCSVLWMRRLSYHFKTFPHSNHSLWKLVRRSGFVMSVRMEPRQEVNAKLDFQSSNFPPYRLHRRKRKKTPTSVWQLPLSYGLSPSYLLKGNTCVKQTSPKMFGYSFAATSRYGSIMESVQCTGV